MSPACPAFSLLPCPLSPRPFPNGEGEIYGYFMQGAPPLASPAFNRLRHLQTFSNMNPAGGLPGWSPADLATAVPGGGLAPISQCRPGSALGDARGGAPCIRKQKSPPSPEGKSALRARAGGMGATKQAKGRAGERQGRQAAQRIPERHSHPATTRASSPQGATVARSASATSSSALGMQGAKPLA